MIAEAGRNSSQEVKNITTPSEKDKRLIISSKAISGLIDWYNENKMFSKARELTSTLNERLSRLKTRQLKYELNINKLNEHILSSEDLSYMISTENMEVIILD